MAYRYIADQLKRCLSLKEIESWYGFMLKSNRMRDCFLTNQYITACSSFHCIDSATFAFTQMENPNVFVYNAMIGAFVDCFRPYEALCSYVDMMRSGICPSSYTFPAVIKSCRVLSIVGCGECVHGHVSKNGLGSRIHVKTALIDFYSSLGRNIESRMLFEEMSERDCFAWSTMISAHVRAGDMDSARSLFDEMPEKNTAAWNTMIHGNAEAGDVGSAEELFNKMLNRDLISWTTMINCYAKHKRYKDAVDLFYKMKVIGIKPDEVTVVTVLSACAHLGALDQGKEIHFYIVECGFNLDIYIGSSLIDMYVKCGVLERALVIFFNLPEKNLFCRSAIIDGLAFHGLAVEALVMFYTMKKEEIEPNGVIFVSILAACTHAGLVDEGKRIFHEMTRTYSIIPEIEHYGCMVDLLCRAGLLEEALELIRSMRMQPNSVVWGALLGGCKLHKNLEIALVAVDELINLEPNNSGYYTLLVNMFAEANRWNEVAKIRSIIKERGVEKMLPGSSWIEVKKKMYQFAACDKFHPAFEEIHSLVDMLDLQIKLFGYASEVDLSC